MTSSYVPLHVHSHYSLLDGLPKIKELVSRAFELGLPAMALTDHGNLYGSIEFYLEMTSAGLQPILGFEAYLAPEGVEKKLPRERPGHMVLLARDAPGWQNLMRLTSAAHLLGMSAGIPRLDHSMLARYGQGLILLTGCWEGEIPMALAAGDQKKADFILTSYRQAVGSENVYIELNPPDRTDGQKNLNRLLIEFARRHEAELVATPDSHYLDPQDQEAADILLCIGHGRKVAETNRPTSRGMNAAFRSPEEMAQIFGEVPEALTNSLAIAERCRVTLELGKWRFPHFPIPSGQNPATFLSEQSQHGLVERYGGSVPDEVKKRLDYELEVICGKGFAPYFLIVADFVNWARRSNITTTTRGSAAGSLVSFALGITTVNPLDFHLPFERFLNLERPSPPDIDVDIADNRRDEVIAYVRQKYGQDRVAQIGTFGTMLARAAVRDAGRALGLPYGFCDRVAKMIPIGQQGFPMTIARAKKENPEFAETAAGNAEAKRLIEVAERIEGNVRHASVHAAGLVVAPDSLTDFVPLQHDPDGSGLITQFDMHAVEAAGLVKMDFLGIRNLTILDLCRAAVTRRHQTTIDLDHLPLDDKKTFSMLGEGRTVGLFQLGSEGMTRALVDMKPTRVEDLMALVALYRPGPVNSIPEYIRRKHNPRLIDYLDERLKPILEKSYGVLVYQDDVLLIAIKLAGYTWMEADKLRKAMGKKIPAEMAAQKAKLIKGLMNHGLSQEKSVAMWQLIEPFAAYGFNKAHAASYGMVAYQTAFCKANFPVEYMAAVLTAESGNLDTVAEAIAEARAMGITVLGPDLNESGADFTIIEQTATPTIRFGLAAIKHLGDDTIRALLAERKSGSEFVDLEDFLLRLPERALNKRALESLIRSGTLERFGERGQLLASTEQLLEFGRRGRERSTSNQTSLFGPESMGKPKIKLIQSPPATSTQKLADEKEHLGLYLSASPLDRYRRHLDPLLAGAPPGLIRVAGVVTTIKKLFTKRGESMLFVTIESGRRRDLVIFPRLLETTTEVWEKDKLVLIEAKRGNREDDTRLVVERVWVVTDDTLLQLEETLKNVTSATNQEIIITLPQHPPATLKATLKEIFTSTPGDTRVILETIESGSKRIRTPYTIDVERARPALDALLKNSN